MAIRSGLFKQELFKTDSDGDKTRTSWWTSTETVDIDEGMDNEETALVDATSWDTTYDTASTQPTGLTNFISKVTTFFKNVKFLKNRVDTMNTSLQQGIDSANTNANGRVSKTGDTMSGDLLFADSSTTTRQIRGVVGTNDYWRVAGGATAANGGWMEIATADDGNEPIYARQYTGVYSNPTRTATILGNNGQTEFPVSVKAPSFIEGNTTLSGKYLSITTASNTYAKKNDVYTKSESDSRYGKNIVTLVEKSDSNPHVVNPGETTSMVSITCDPGTWIITATTSWKSGYVGFDGHVVGHQITTSSTGSGALNPIDITASVTVPYAYYNNTRPSCTSIIKLTRTTTLYLIAYNRHVGAIVCDGGEMSAIRVL